MRPAFRRAYRPSALISSDSAPKRCGVGMEKFWLTSRSRLISTSQTSTKSPKGNADLHLTTKQGSQFVDHPATFPSSQDSSTSRAAVSAGLTPGKRKPGRSRRCVITTLDPAQLDSSCFLDVSGRTYTYVYDFASPESPYLLHMSYAISSEGILHETFPPGTRGFLYFYWDAHNPLLSQIRFRAAQDRDSARSFTSGHDLVFGSGFIWHIPIVNAARRPRLREMLLREGLVDNALLAQLQALPPSTGRRRLRRAISVLDQPFIVDFTCRSLSLIVRTAEQDRWYNTDGPITYCTGASSRKGVVCEAGAALCRLERSTLPQHAGRRIVILRLLEILQPPKRRSGLPPAALDVSVPAEGELFKSGEHVWYRDVDRYGEGPGILRLLYDAPRGGEQASSTKS